MMRMRNIVGLALLVSVLGGCGSSTFNGIKRDLGFSDPTLQAGPVTANASDITGAASGASEYMEQQAGARRADGMTVDRNETVIVPATSRTRGELKALYERSYAVTEFTKEPYADSKHQLAGFIYTQWFHDPVMDIYWQRVTKLDTELAVKKDELIDNSKTMTRPDFETLGFTVVQLESTDDGKLASRE